MQVNIALDGPRQRNLKWFAGDEMTLSVVVYAVDGDLAPVAVTNLVLTTAPDESTYPIGSQFVVPTDWPGRRYYWIKGEIGGVLTTLAYGWLIIKGGEWTRTGGGDYGWAWPFNGWRFPW